MIYFDNAATTIHKPDGVARAAAAALMYAGNPGRGAHEPTLYASRLVYSVREKLARLFNVPDASQIAFTANATEALNTAIYGLFTPKDHIITTVCEHNSVLRPIYRLYGEAHAQLSEQDEGNAVCTASFLQADLDGRLKSDELEHLLKENTKALIVTHASNVTGNITELERISSFARRHGLWLIVDAAQSAGAIDIDVQKFGIDVLCFTGHKGLMGPQGTGGIYVRKGLKLNPFKVGGSGIKSFERTMPETMPELLEAGTLNVHGIAGLGAALDWINDITPEAVREKELRLSARFAEGVQNVKSIKLYGAGSTSDRVGIVSLNIADEDSAFVADVLWEEYGICVRAGAHCAPLMHIALNTKKQGAVRFSFSYFNTEDEIDKAIRAVRELAGNLV